METISFYSFKGGAGKSLAASQLAVLLARFNKTVVLLDLDLEAPGIENKFSSYKFFPNVEYGLVDYIDEFLSNNNINNVINNTIRIQIGENGNIFIFSSGNIQKIEYWDKINSEKFRSFVSGKDNRIVRFIDKLKSVIIKELKPDYLIIDSKSGINELSGISLYFFPDKVVILCTNNKDSILGTNRLLRHFNAIRKTNPQVPIDENIFLVLSRIPYYYYDLSGNFKMLSEKEIEEMKRVFYEAIFQQVKNNPGDYKYSKYVLASEPRIQLQEYFPIPFTGKADSSPLSRDYLTLFSGIIPELEENFKELLSDIGFLRPYLLIQNEGKMINPEDKSWNVAFRVDTLTNTLANLYSSIYTQNLEFLKSEDKAIEAANVALQEAGFTAAIQFAQYLNTKWQKEELNEKHKLSYEQKINQWCAFDSTVGFGKFNATIWGDGKEGLIEVIDNFLLYNKDSIKFDLSWFLIGYIKKILTSVFSTIEEKISIEHKVIEKEFIVGNKKNKIFTSQFKYSIIN